MKHLIWKHFHTMWGKAKDGLVYHKEDWNELQRLIEDLEHPRDTQRFLVPGPTAPIVVAAMLVDEKRWFRITPMPEDDLFEFTVSKEWLPLIVRQLIATSCGTSPPAY